MYIYIHCVYLCVNACVAHMCRFITAVQYDLATVKFYILQTYLHLCVFIFVCEESLITEWL